MRIILILLTLMVSASAQTIRDKNGNPLGYFQQQGSRTYFRDNNGNPRGYTTTLSNGTIEHRDNNGNLLYTEK